jgi:syntaxin-binding protein 5
MSGSTVIHPLSRLPDGTWSVSEQTEQTDSASHPLPNASFVIDSKTGRRCKANGDKLKEVLSPASENAEKGRYLWVTAGEKGAKCVVDITGNRIGRVDWPSKAGKVEQVAVVQKNGEQASYL